MSHAIDRETVTTAILGSPADAIVATGADGRIVLWNTGAERIFGFSQSEAIGQSLDIIVPERLRERHWSGFRAVMASGHSRYSEGDQLSVPALRKDGQTVSLEFTIVALRGSRGEMLGIAAI